MDIAKEIKKEKNLSVKTTFLSSYLISERFSPYFSKFYIKKNVTPNMITMHMIISGIIGAILFAMPNIYVKILGAIFIHLWFILDCSDGEVARYTKTFSKFGKELDFMAHLINHPLFGLALFLSLVQLERYHFYLLAVLIMISNLLDYLNRNVIAMKTIIDLKEPSDGHVSQKSEKWTLKQKIAFITDIFTIYPNFILFGVIIYFVDFLLGSHILLGYIIMNIFLTSGLMLLVSIRLLKKFYH
ncbi:MAG: CDP-alcohol phosphatidyltransferase family protein [Caldibacillus thermoamylovorans]